MAILTREMIPAGLKEVEHITYVKAVQPGRLPVIGAYATRKLVAAHGGQLSQDFPNVVDSYLQPLPQVTRRLQRNRNVARYIITGETWIGTPLDSYSHIGMLTMVPGELDDVPETLEGTNVAAWLAPSAAGRGYLTRIAAELASEGHPEQVVWTVARPDNEAASGLLSNIGMAPVGVPEHYDIGDNVSTTRQLYVSTVGDVAQTAGLHAATHYPVEEITL